MDEKEENPNKLSLKLQVMDLKDDKHFKELDNLRRRIVALEDQVSEVVVKKT